MLIRVWFRSTWSQTTFKQPGGAVLGTCPIVGGQVSGTIPITDGGFGYTTQPSINIQAPPGAGTQATASPLIESRLYGDIVNNIKRKLISNTIVI